MTQEEDNSVQDNQDNNEMIDLDADITEEEIRYAIDKLKTGKAPGVDQIPPEFYKCIRDNILGYLKSLYNTIFNKAKFPTAWATAIIVPIFKRGNVDNPNNYRGISLLNILSKIFTSVLTNRLYNWAEQNDRIRPEQAGFRRNYSTTDHIFTLRQIISNALYGERRQKIYCIFVDYQKAFDTVKRHVVWEILEKIGVTNKFLKMLKGIYERVLGRVRAGNELTDEFECPLGLRQGCKLSPIIFSLLINEVAEDLDKKARAGYQLMRGKRDIKSLMFADDLAIISDTPAGLQRAINVLQETSQRLGLTINLDKTKVMVFRAGGFLGRREKWFLGDKKIDVVNSYKYLGFILTTKLSGEIALSDYVGKAKRKIINIIRTMKALGKHNASVFFKLIDAQVKPLALYASEVWGVFPHETVEKIQLFALKKLLGVTKKTPNCLVYGETGRFPFSIDTKARAVSYWLKVTNMDTNRLPRLAYERELKEREKRYNWAREVKNILDRAGFSYVWNSEGVTNERGFIRKLKRRLRDIYMQDWNHKCQNSPRCETYMTIKDTYDTEQYIMDIDLSKFVYTVARLRTGVSELNTHRSHTQQNPMTTCPFCNTDETELHFINECHMYNHLRTKYLTPHFKKDNTTELRTYLCTKDKTEIRALAQYLDKAIKYRRNEVAYKKQRSRHLAIHGQGDKYTQTD